MKIEIINLKTGEILFTAKNGNEVAKEVKKNESKLKGLCGLDIGVKRCVSPNGKYTILPLHIYLD